MLKDKDGNIIQNHGKDQDTIIQNGIEYDYTYSPNGFMIERDGIPYADAVDPLGSNRIYIETDTPIEPAEDSEVEETEDYVEAAKILLGEEE